MLNESMTSAGPPYCSHSFPGCSRQPTKAVRLILIYGDIHISYFLSKVQEVWPSLTFTLSHKSAMKPRDLVFFSCFTTLALHLEPPGRRSPPPSIGRPRVPTGTTTSRHARLGEQLGRSLEEAGQAGGGRDEVLGVHRSCGKTGTGEFSCVPLSPRTEFMMFCE